MNRTNVSAFSLIELLLVVTVVGLIIFVLANLTSSFGLIGSGNYETLAKQISLKQIDELRTQTYDNLANATTTISDSRLSQIPSSSGQRVIADCPSNICTSGEQTKQATITINWSESGKAKSIQIDTFISKGGLR